MENVKVANGFIKTLKNDDVVCQLRKKNNKKIQNITHFDSFFP